MQSPEQARSLVEQIVDAATRAGATAADAAYLGSASSSVEVRNGQLEGVDRSEGEKLGLRVFIGQRVASASVSDFSDDSRTALVERLIAMAKEATEDQYAGLAPKEMLASGDAPDLDLVDEHEPEPEALKERALAAEAAALAIEGVTNSQGTAASASSGLFAIATSHGFSGTSRSTGHGCTVSVVAERDGAKERDYHWMSARHLEDLDDPEAIGREAGERTVARLGPKPVKPGKYPILFDSRVATSLLSHLSGAISGASVARRSSFLMDRMGEQVFAKGIDIIDDPLRRRGLRSHAFDGEGLPVKKMKMIEDGVLRSWYADSAAARQLGIDPTGHAIRGPGGGPGAGPSNYYIAAGQRSPEEMMADVGTAILVTDMMGQGVNGVTGDYSRGAAGFLVRNGEIVHPVSEITVAGNLKDMFASLEPANDLEFKRGVDAPTILIPEMTVGSA
ncbi:TldD/PmbA family protein [Sphingomicrobium clamense]|uniref:TldD/PmbA family protein n=1 Tax=Sphingomicrobium clamense TaxID=2851013 RepID=A0ABS6V4P9_9SPHN|nr:metallopeptidase TldD-related protein [Sphingomicrobium sp. B8]MBW0144335.1 TldD/PmbA family protein [Sphingomicrobium sp. B8]